MPKETMTPRERWLAVLKGQKSGRVPMDYWATEEATKKLMNYLKCDNEEELFKRLHIDRVITIEPKYIGNNIFLKRVLFVLRKIQKEKLES